MSAIDAYSGYIYLAAFLGFGAYALKKIVEWSKHRASQTTARAKAGGLTGMNPLSKYNSFSEFLSELERGLDIQAQDIAKQCDKRKINPMDDVGYQTVMNRYKQVQEWKGRFESPIGAIADGITFPIVQQAPNWIWKQAKDWLM